MRGEKGEPSVKTVPYDVEAKRNLDHGSTDRAVEYIKRNADGDDPFFLYLGYTHFHPPWGVHDDFKNKSGAGVYADTKMEVDHNIGVVLDAIDNARIADNTIVILTGDNGAANYPSPGIVTGEVGGSNGPWRGGLGTTYEGGMRSPAMIRWPGKVPSGVVSDEIVSALDWLPTVASMSGVPELVPSDRPIDGVDQSAFLMGQTEKSAREYVVAYQGEKVWAVKWRNMKVHFATAEGTHSIVQTYTFPQVFDIKEDPKESYELWGNEGYIHTWVMGPVTSILTEIGASMVEFSNIKPGQDFEGYK